MLRSHRLFESLMPTKTLLKSMERSETPSKSCKQMRRKRFTVRKLESSLDEMRRILLAKIATLRLPFENPRVTVNYSNLPHSQDYLAPGIEHGTPHATFIAK